MLTRRLLPVAFGIALCACDEPNGPRLDAGDPALDAAVPEDDATIDVDADDDEDSAIPDAELDDAGPDADEAGEQDATVDGDVDVDTGMEGDAASDGGDSDPTEDYQGNTLIGPADGYLVDWLANDRLLVNRYRVDRLNPAGPVYDHAEIVDTSGAVLDELALPPLLQITRVAGGQIYGRDTNTIYSTEDASVLWSSTNLAVRLQGDVAGDRVVFVSGDPIRPSVSGHLVRSEAR